MKRKKNQLYGGSKVIGQATLLTHLAHKVGGRLAAVPNRLRSQWQCVIFMVDFIAFSFLQWFHAVV